MADTCSSCSDPLFLTLSPSESGPSTIPDDLLLPCACHFHWQCLLDEASSILSSHSCPSCSQTIVSSPAGGSSSSSQPPSHGTLLTTYTNEGGTEFNLDIIPTLLEEAYLEEHPESRPARALHTLIAQGDVSGILSLLIDIDNDEESEMNSAQILRWRDPLNGGKSALHVAIEAQQEEPFWMILWLASGMGDEYFPEEMRQVGLSREQAGEGEDVRFLTDGEGRTAGDLLKGMAPPWGLYCVEGMLGGGQ